MKRYSLATHIFSIKPNDARINSDFGTISIGGEGNYLDSIRISMTETLWNTQGFSTGAWVHNKNLSRIGTAQITLSQISDDVVTLIRLCETYYGGDYDGFTLTLSKNDGSEICTCYDCYITKIPDQDYQSSAQSQSWTFTCGKIVYN